MKHIIAITLISFSLIYLASCNKEEETAKPVITFTEVGYENSGTAARGSDLHLEATVEAEGKISTIRVILHPEGEHGLKTGTGILNEGDWEYDTTYTEFSGLKNCTFHKHVPIPLTADTGQYHLDFTVTDLEGNQASLDADVKITSGSGKSAVIIRK